MKAERQGDKIIVSWDASTDDKTPQQSLFYNLYVKYPGVERCLVPALPESGRLKVVQDMQTLPMATSYELTVPADVATADIEIGVQAIDGVFAPSAFTKVEELTATGISDAQRTAFSAKTAPIYNLQGQRVGQTQKGISIVGGKKVLR